MKYTVRKCLRIIEMHGRDNIARRQRQEISGITFRAMNLLKKITIPLSNFRCPQARGRTFESHCICCLRSEAFLLTEQLCTPNLKNLQYTKYPSNLRRQRVPSRRRAPRERKGKEASKFELPPSHKSGALSPAAVHGPRRVVRRTKIDGQKMHFYHFCFVPGS